MITTTDMCSSLAKTPALPHLRRAMTIVGRYPRAWRQLVFLWIVFLRILEITLTWSLLTATILPLMTLILMLTRAAAMLWHVLQRTEKTWTMSILPALLRRLHLGHQGGTRSTSPWRRAWQRYQRMRMSSRFLQRCGRSSLTRMFSYLLSRTRRILLWAAVQQWNWPFLPRTPPHLSSARVSTNMLASAQGNSYLRSVLLVLF